MLVVNLSPFVTMALVKTYHDLEKQDWRVSDRKKLKRKQLDYVYLEDNACHYFEQLLKGGKYGLNC